MVGKRWALIWTMLLGSLMAAHPAFTGSQEPQKLHLEAYADFDYNTNATQQPTGTGNAQLVTGRGSLVLTQGLRSEYNFFPAETFNLQLKYNYFQNFYTRASLVNTMMHTWTVGPSYLFGKYHNIKFWVPFSFNYTDVGSDKYYTYFFLNPSLFYRVSQTSGYAVEMRLTKRYGWIPQFFPQFYDYTAREIGGTVGYYYFIGKTGGYVQARLNYDYIGARGSNNSHASYRLLLSGEYPVTTRLNVLLYLDLGLAPYDQSYQDGTEVPYPKRQDKTLILAAIAEYKVYKGFICSLHYYFTRWDSNIALYDYTSHIFGGQLAYRY
jgi:hypothetical protein